MSIQKNNLKIKSVMMSMEEFPVLSDKTILKEALEQMDKFRLGIACIINNEGNLIGILTDGDIRRKLLSVQKPISAFFIDDAIKHAIVNPIVISPSNGLYDSVVLMGKKRVWDLPVVENNKLVGLLHLHPLVEEFLDN